MRTYYGKELGKYNGNKKNEAGATGTYKIMFLATF